MQLILLLSTNKIGLAHQLHTVGVYLVLMTYVSAVFCICSDEGAPHIKYSAIVIGLIFPIWSRTGINSTVLMLSKCKSIAPLLEIALNLMALTWSRTCIINLPFLQRRGCNFIAPK